MKIGILKEGKVPADARVALTPEQCAFLIKEKQLDLVVQKSPIRCFEDKEYAAVGVPLVDSVADCDILIGVKEVPINELIADKSYFFFSHTIKKQPYNKPLLKEVLAKKIRLIDYEVLTNDKGNRLIAFGFFAGMVGAYNGMLGYGLQHKSFKLERLSSFLDYEEAKAVFQKIEFPPMKVVLTGTGRVGKGAAKVLLDMGLEQVAPADFLANKNPKNPIFVQLAPSDYARSKTGADFQTNEFYTNPQNFESAFAPFSQSADWMINGVYWDNAAPAFFTSEQMKSPEFSIQLIADITCDIAPVSSIPSTLKAATIKDPFFGYDVKTGAEIAPFTGGIDMMTIDNLPSELPRDASKSFGEQFTEQIMPALEAGFDHPVILRGTIAHDGALGPHFEYLTDYALG